MSYKLSTWSKRYLWIFFPMLVLMTILLRGKYHEDIDYLWLYVGVNPHQDILAGLTGMAPTVIAALCSLLVMLLHYWLTKLGRAQ